MDALKAAYRPTLRVKREFERSIRDNEDGFFLQLYKVLCDAMFRARLILQSEFNRQRVQMYQMSGGYGHVQHHKIASLMQDQYHVLNTVRKLIYLMAFEVFPFDETVFRDQVTKELKQYDKYKELMQSETPKVDHRIAAKMRSPFIKVHTDIEAERSKHFGMEFEMNKQMLDKYIK